MSTFDTVLRQVDGALYAGRIVNEYSPDASSDQESYLTALAADATRRAQWINHELILPGALR